MIRRCPRCTRDLPADEFYKGRSWCKRCEIARTRANRARRVEELGEDEVRRRERDTVRRWRENPANREKSRATTRAVSVGADRAGRPAP